MLSASEARNKALLSLATRIASDIDRTAALGGLEHQVYTEDLDKYPELSLKITSLGYILHKRGSFTVISWRHEPVDFQEVAYDVWDDTEPAVK